MYVYVPTYAHICPCMTAYIHIYIYAYKLALHIIILHQLSKIQKASSYTDLIKYLWSLYMYIDWYQQPSVTVGNYI